MPNTFSKPLDKGQRTKGIYKAQTSQGAFQWLCVRTKLANSTDGFTMIVLIYRRIGNHERERSGIVLVVQ